MKKMLGLLCSLAVFLTLFAGLSLPFTASAATYGDFTYTISNGEVSIIDYTGNPTDVVIPGSINGYPVTTIGSRAFYECHALESVTIGDAVTTIGEGAFEYCYSLKSVTMGDAVTTIGEGAFSSCGALESVTMGDAVTTIGVGAFSGCDSLTQIEVAPTNSAYCDIDGVLFTKDGTMLVQYPIGKPETSYVIPDAVTTIGEGAFEYCYSLKSVTMGDAVTTIGNYVFSNCTSLESVTMGDAVTTIGNFAFDWCYALERVTIPDAVTTIGDYAFNYCYSLKSVTIPDAVTTIGDSAFYDCWDLREVYYPGTKAQWKKIDIGVDNEYLSSAYIHYNTTVNHWVLTDVYDEPSCEWEGWAEYTCDCGYTAEFDIPAKGHTGQFIKTVAPTCTEAGYDVYECTTCYDIYYENEIFVAGHTFDNNVCVNCDGAVADCLASAHTYASNTYQSRWVRQAGANSISLTFSPETYVEDECDYLYIYDADGALFGAYTGAQLAGAQITVPGDFVEIRLVSDESMNYYGFAVTDVTVEMDSVEDPDDVRGDIDGNGAVDAQDAAQVFFFVNAVGTLTDEQLLAADVNGDGNVTLADAARLFYMVNGLI